MQSGDADPWKKKYFDALRSLEQEERDFRVLESVLRRIVNRLCFAAMGQTVGLDASLRKLTDAMRKKAGQPELELLFAPLSEAIGALDERDAAKAMGSIASSATTIIAAATAPTQGVATASTTQTVVRPHLDLETAGNGTINRPLLATVTQLHVPAPPAEAVLVADERVRAIISRVLSELRRDPRITKRVAEVDEQLKEPLKELHLPVMLEAIAELVQERIKGIESEKTDVEKLLGQVSQRLDELSVYMAGEDANRKLSLENTQTLNHRLTLEMTELGYTVEGTVDLAQLKSKVRTKLDSIGNHLQEFRAREEDRTREQRDRSEKMRERLERLEQESREMQTRLRDEQRLSLIDALTQISNRLAYDQRMDEEFARWERFHQPWCIAAWDIDYFKRINDAYGHRAGDKVLRIVAETMVGRLRETDFLARYGGEEFVMILPGTESDGAIRVIEEMRCAVAALGFHFRGNPISVSVSCGLTAFRQGDSPDEAFERADKALYRAKEAGRNRYELG